MGETNISTSDTTCSRFLEDFTKTMETNYDISDNRNLKPKQTNQTISNYLRTVLEQCKTQYHIRLVWGWSHKNIHDPRLELPFI